MGHVLITDDEPAIGTYLATLIENLGHKTSTVLTASDTLSHLDKQNFQLVIADIRLPDAPNPQEWIRLLSEKAAGTPIVLISGAPSPEIVEYATLCGVMAFLSKPFELAFIKNIINTVFTT